MNKDDVAIVSALRTPLGNFLGNLSPLSATSLGAKVIQGAVQQAKANETLIDEVIMGCVLPAGLGQAPARQAALAADLAETCQATTINKVCGSGMKAVMLAAANLQIGQSECVIAGGMESMSNAPHLLLKHRQGQRMGHDQLMDHLFLDGLEDAYEPGKLMGWFADETARKYQISREKQDTFALESLKRAKQATEQGWFSREIKPVTVETKKGAVTFAEDENPMVAKVDKIPTLKPAFQPNGTVTAANASAISDGAAALLLTTQQNCQKRDLPIRAWIRGFTTVASHPATFTTAPIAAIQKLLEQLDWNIQSVDCFEINEAFAVVTLAAIETLHLSPEKVNIYGGACALGHPLGASGARILVTLLNALETLNLKRGIATLCIGGGEATAIAIERP